MAGGLPILLSIGGDAATIIAENDAGFRYEGKNPASLVAVIENLGQPGVRDRMARNSLAAHRERFSAEKVYGEMKRFVLSFAEASG
jgi:glycosyltransferase involved in cell wall biosynthesis